MINKYIHIKPNAIVKTFFRSGTLKHTCKKICNYFFHLILWLF